ncbi:MAG: acetyl-CoA C-acyltransferase [Sphingobacteriales bacterium]
MKKEVFVVSAVRTPIGSFGGVLKSFSAIDLGAIAIKAAVEQSGIDKTKVDELLMGSVIQANLGQAPARQAARKAGLPDHVACTTVNKVCASGLKAIVQGAQSILLGDADVVVAGGMESMSNVPFYSEHMRWGNKYGHVQFLDGIARDGLIDAYDGKAMGVAAEKCASECGISREEQDTFAIESYRRAQKAWEEGNFTNEVIPVVIPQKKGDDVVVDKDEEPWNIKYDKVAGLRPAFIEGGNITAANASTMNDGAAAVVLVSGEKLKEWNLTPLAKIVSYADAEQAPEWFTTTPALALPRAIQKAGLNATDISYWEINEAFSVVGIENMRRLGVHHEQLNVHGGAVAIGHPLGCSGTRIIVSLIHILMQRSARYGAAGICNGGGGASAMVIENLAG